MGKFKFGFYLGSALGAGMAWLNLTEKGREKRAELLDHAAVVYSDLKESIQNSEAWDKMSENDYVKLVTEKIDKYALKSGMALRTKKMLTSILKKQWKNLQKELRKNRRA